MDFIDAGWRLAQPAGLTGDGKPQTVIEAQPGKTLFESIEQSGLTDDRTFVIARTELSFAILNVFPYTTGHVMVLPLRAVPDILALSAAEHDDLWALVRTAYQAVRSAFQPHGMNVGINEGVAGGASQPDHLHVHVVPRWAADTSFTTTAAGARVLPMTLVESWQRVRASWPDEVPSSG